ncbi:type IV pilin-like G/H family protein [Microcoleus vaginatus]|uniref:type IV pilin-like G/H family protein n=1 Tax=Microcoleus vaginatus TaxID=119532 RepID=UPI00168A2813|nr:type IV pilin-like G/H family protein [Microcoleus sp. FACHB-84]MBD2011667.1 type IV pilin-like G/H family protein [Microcoleus sp. FACHB-45]
MKTEFKAKFLQQLNKRRQDQGFTLIELLVVIIIIGILSAIALPSFLSQANKAKQSEAKQYISSLNKGQQAFYAEKGTFVTTITELGSLGLGLKSVTNNYTYALAGAQNGVAATAQGVTGLRNYAGGVTLVVAAGAEAASTQTILCESKTIPTTSTAPNFTMGVECTGDWTAVK